MTDSIDSVQAVYNTSNNENVWLLYLFIMSFNKDLLITIYLSCLVSWAALRSSCMFLVICSVLQITSSVQGRVASSSPSSPWSTASEAGRGLLQMERKPFTAVCTAIHEDSFKFFISTTKQSKVLFPVVKQMDTGLWNELTAVQQKLKLGKKIQCQ